MAHIHYECDANGIFHGKVSDGTRSIKFRVSSSDIMRAGSSSGGIDLLNEVITACIKKLPDLAPGEDDVEIAIESMRN